MATRALVGFINDGPELISTYNHYDGYPDNLGVALENFYEEPNEALKIASMGYISYVSPETGEIDAKHKEPADHTDLDMDFNDAMLKIAEVANSYGADYIYIYDIVDSEWVNVKMYGTRQTGEALAFALQNLDGTVFPDPVRDLPAAPDQIGETYETKWKKFLNEEQVDMDMIYDYADRLLGADVEDFEGLADWYAVNPDEIPEPMDANFFIKYKDEIVSAANDQYRYDSSDADMD